MNKVCVVCGKEFDASHPHHRKLTCSEECSITYKKYKYRERYYNYRHNFLKNARRRKCIYCGELYSPWKAESKYCSIECAREYEKKLYRLGWKKRKKATYDNNCEYCGKKFVARYKLAKYCSDECKKKGRILWDMKRQEEEEQAKNKNKPSISLAEACRQMNELGIQYAEWYRLYGGNK